MASNTTAVAVQMVNTAGRWGLIYIIMILGFVGLWWIIYYLVLKPHLLRVETDIELEFEKFRKKKR
jgi:hypothetical protein